MGGFPQGSGGDALKRQARPDPPLLRRIGTSLFTSMLGYRPELGGRLGACLARDALGE